MRARKITIKNSKAQLLQSIYFHKRALLDLTLIAFIGLISFSWFRGDYLIKTGDDTFPLNPTYAFYTNSYVWYHFLSTGTVVDPLALTSIPFFFCLMQLTTVGIPLVALQNVFYYATFILSGISAYLLTASLLSKNKRAAGFASALFYMMNPYSLSVIWAAHYTTLLFTYSFAPIFIALYIKGINAKEKRKYVMSIGLIELLMSPMFDDPSQAFVVLFLIPVLFFIFYILIERKDKAKVMGAFRFSLYLILVSIALNSWWILPGVYLAHVRYELSTSAYSSMSVFVYGSYSSTMWNTFRLLGFYFIWAKWYPVSIYAWAETYSSPAFVFLGSLVPIFAFASIFFKGRNRYVAFFVQLSFLGLFLSKGIAEPLGFINMWLYQNVPFAAAFRTHFVRFGYIIVLGYTFLVGVTFGELWERLRKAQSASVYQTDLRKPSSKGKNSLKVVTIASLLSFIIIGFIVYNYPFWTGDVIYPGSQYLPSARIQVPSYYTDAGNYINEQPGEFRIIDFPPRVVGTSAYAWKDGYIASDPIDQYYIHKPLVGIGFLTNIEEQFFDMLSTGELPKSFGKALSLLDVKYILVHNDFNWSLVSAPKIAVGSLEGFRLEKTFGKLDLYRNQYWKPSFLYGTSNAILVEGAFNDLLQITEREDFKVGKELLLLSEQLNPNILPDSSITRYNPINVTVQVFDGWTDRVNWFSTFNNNTYAARYYAGWKGVIGTSGGDDLDMIIFSSRDVCPYVNALDGSGGWAAFDSTLVYIVTENNPLVVNSILADGKPVTDLVGIWWETGCKGGATRPITYPIAIPSQQRAIIQINHKADIVNLLIEPPDFQIPLATNQPTMTYQQISPTKYIANVNTSEPFFLVFSESYRKDWVAYIDGQQMPNEYHFVANGFANAWYINKTGSVAITLEFWPQKLLYIGSPISIATLILCILYVSKDKLKTTYKRYIKKNKTKNTTQTTRIVNAVSGKFQMTTTIEWIK